MEFIEEVADKKTILKQDIGVNPFLLENNVNQICLLYTSPSPRDS